MKAVTRGGPQVDFRCGIASRADTDHDIVAKSHDRTERDGLDAAFAASCQRRTFIDDAPLALVHHRECSIVSRLCADTCGNGLDVRIGFALERVSGKSAVGNRIGFAGTQPRHCLEARRIVRVCSDVVDSRQLVGLVAKVTGVGEDDETDQHGDDGMAGAAVAVEPDHGERDEREQDRCAGQRQRRAERHHHRIDFKNTGALEDDRQQGNRNREQGEPPRPDGERRKRLDKRSTTGHCAPVGCDPKGGRFRKRSHPQ